MTSLVLTDASFFRTMVLLSSASVQEILPGIAACRNQEALGGLLDFLEKDGFPDAGKEDCLANNKRFSTNKLGGCMETSFSDSILRTTIDSNKIFSSEESRNKALSVIDRFISVHDRYAKDHDPSKRSEFINSIFFDSIALVHDRDFLESLVSRGASTTKFQPTRKSYVGDRCSPLTESIRHSNLVAMECLINYQGKSRHDFSLEIESPQTLFKDAKADHPTKVLAKAFHDRPEAVLSIFSALEKHHGYEATMRARCRVLSFHLADAWNVSTAWNEKHIETLINGSARLRRAVTKAIKEDAKQIATESREKMAQPQIWRELFEHALMSHCTPVLSLFTERLKASSSFASEAKENPLKAVCGGRSAPWSFDSRRFKSTLELLVAHGHDLGCIENGQLPAVHILAQNKDDSDIRAQKLAVLLAMDVNPYQLNGSGIKACPPIRNNGKATWNMVLRAFEARKMTLSLLDEVNAPSP